MNKIGEIKKKLYMIGFREIGKTIGYKISKYMYDVWFFGICIAHYNFWGDFASLLPGNLGKIVKKKKLVHSINFLEKKYAYFIESYKGTVEIKDSGNNKIWVLWWQGLEKAPELIKFCVESIKMHKSGYEVVLLDKNNYGKYVKLPDYILKKINEKKISITHLSDIIRMSLLSRYGGIWVDATIFVNEDIFLKFENKNLNSNYSKKIVEENGGFEKRCGFFIGGRAGNRLFSFVYDFFMQYHRDYSYLINYFLIDYVIYIAYRNFEDCKSDIDKIDIINDGLYNLASSFNDIYSYMTYNEIMNYPFFKLSWKLHFDKKINGKKTVYGKFIEDNSSFLEV